MAFRIEKKMIEKMGHWSRTIKRLVILGADFLLLPLALWCAIAVRLGAWQIGNDYPWWIFFLPSIIAIPVFIRLGLYRAVVRYIEDKAIATIAVAVTISTLVFAGVYSFLALPLIPRGALLIYWIIAIFYISGSRFFARAMLRSMVPRSRMSSVVIYGAGQAGRQLSMALMAGNDYTPVGFIDDNPAIQGLVIGGLRVYAPEILPDLIRQYDASQVLLAMPSASRARRIEIINLLEQLHVEVRAVPGMADLVSGEARVTDVREVDIDDLLGRDPVPPIEQLMRANISGLCVMVTGAGGSIGSELCRQIIRQEPVRLVLYEQSEFALYSIEHELKMLATARNLQTEIVPVLGSVQNGLRVQGIMTVYDVKTVYHAAAYKHVPIVEFNMTEGILNNVFGTKAVAFAAINAGVDTFVLISTDKAVRPTNVMGASKRIAELVLQAHAAQEEMHTRFSMVRFGNVLGSSGSVVPLFRKQIAEGNAVTVTHPDITRYFMTIPEAAQLVIQAGAMGSGGEVFVLDMGGPVKILDLAKRMIHLSGYCVRDESSGTGDIAINFTGLRPGEKLYEELLISGDVVGTDHPRILKAQENFLEKDALDSVLAELMQYCTFNNCEHVIELLGQHVSGFKPDSAIRDHLRSLSSRGMQPLSD